MMAMTSAAAIVPVIVRMRILLRRRKFFSPIPDFRTVARVVVPALYIPKMGFAR